MSAAARDSDAGCTLVTGGAGFIGSHCIDRLLTAGESVVVLDNFSTGHRKNLARWEGHDALLIIEADVSDPPDKALEPARKRFGRIRRLLHLAAQVSVVRSIEDPAFDLQNNYLSTLRMIDYAQAHDVEKIVLTSSSAVYGDPEKLPVDESVPARPLSPYGVHKRSAELLLAAAMAAGGPAFTALRLFNVYGPRQDPSSPYSGVISIFMQRALAGQPLSVFGDGEQSRDFVYVKDVARALVAAGDPGTADGAILNIGTSNGVTINALARAVKTACDAPTALDVEHLPARAGEIMHSVTATDRATEALGFSAETALATGLAETADWYRQ